MTRALGIAGLLAAALAATAGAAGPAVDEAAFRWVRPLERRGPGPAIVEPDARMFAHARPGFPDLRVVTPAGGQVAWRSLPGPAGLERRRLAVLYRGTQTGKAVVLLDAGATRRGLDRIDLDIPARGFVGRAEVLGSDDRTAFTKLSSTVVYDIEGARSARSTAAVFPPASVRYYLVRVGGVPAVTGGTAVATTGGARPVVVRDVQRVTLTRRPRSTVVTLDLGFRRVPVDRLRITSSTPVYDRAVAVRESDTGTGWSWASVGRASRLQGSIARDVEAGTASRFVRVVIENGDDPPLADLEVMPLADSRAILVRGGDPGRLRLLYGNPRIRPPVYDFELLPRTALDLGTARPAALGPERRNPAGLPAPDVRSVFERWDWLVPGLLGLAAFGIGAAGVVAALRPRRPGGGARGRPAA